MATEARDMALKTAAEFHSHTDECGRRYGSLEAKIDGNEAERRRDADEWRKGLGVRLDQQDEVMAGMRGLAIRIFGWLVVGILSVLGTVTGLWLHSAGVIK